MEPIRFEDVGERHFVGVCRTVEMKTAGEGIMQVWMDFSKVNEVESMDTQLAYGLMPKNEPGSSSFDYMAAYGVDELATSHAEHDVLTVGAGQYAVFRHDGLAADARSTWDPIFNQWMPSSAYEHDVLPFQEVYNDSFNSSTGQGGFEIWIPVISKA